MNKKLQIFVSSTYIDLRQERQAAVEAILRAGHIPAGMELFSAGDKGQLETIYRWIDESDVYMLILGGRYGSREPDSQKSYTQLEYEYALNVGKRFFAVVLSDGAIETKVKLMGSEALERDRPDALRAFRGVVLSKICRMVDDEKDIKLAIHETLLEFLRQYQFDGWVSGKDIANADDMAREIAKLSAENAKLQARLQEQQQQKSLPKDSLDSEFEEIASLLADQFLTHEGKAHSVIDWLFVAQNSLVTGVANKYDASPYQSFLFFQLAPKLKIHGLTEEEKVAGVQWRRVRTTRKGDQFLVYLQKRRRNSELPKSSKSESRDVNPEAVDKKGSRETQPTSTTEKKPSAKSRKKPRSAS